MFGCDLQLVEIGNYGHEAVSSPPGFCEAECRARTVPIRNDVQRQLLDEVKEFAKGGSLIPAQLNYVQQLNRYQRQLRNAGLTKLHGLRHAYAQQRYLDLTGWKAPVAGGPTSKQLTPEQVAPDYEARAIVSSELGHARVEIAAVYLGR